MPNYQLNFSPRTLGWQRLLATLLHYANANPPIFSGNFYELKNRLLHRYGVFRGHELQEIKKDCWGDKYDDWGDLSGCGPKCTRCGGSGIFDVRWVRLEIWHWQGFVFHRPDGDTRIPPDPSQVKIKGVIQHPKYGRKSREAVLWLYLLSGEFKTFWHAIKGSRMNHTGLWPMLGLQRVVMPTAMFLSRRKCFCGRIFQTWASGWQICRECRRKDKAMGDEGIPF